MVELMVELGAAFLALVGSGFYVLTRHRLLGVGLQIASSTTFLVLFLVIGCWPAALLSGVFLVLKGRTLLVWRREDGVL